jgi:hypothetical protein
MTHEDETKAPWKRRNPLKKSGSSRKLTAVQKNEARARARRAGRPYPTLVDNMAVARKPKAASKRPASKAD